MRGRILTISLILVCAGLTLNPQPSGAIALAPNSNGRIAFIATDPQTEWPEVYTILPDGSELTQITRTVGAAESGPAWSPDGSFLAYARWHSSGGCDVVVRDMSDGSEIVVAASERSQEDCSDPDWSPSGSHLVYSLRDDLSYKRVWQDRGKWLTSSFAASQDGAACYPQACVENASSPTWSPDGRAIAFHAGDYYPENEGIDIHIIQRWGVDREGSGLERIEIDGREFDPDWTPDGTWLLFSRLQQGIWAMAADGTSLTQVLQEGREGRWSPDGTRIVFTTGGDIDPETGEPLREIHIAHASGANPRFLVEGWSPDWEAILPGRCTAVGTTGSDWMIGRPFHDVLCLGDGDDHVSAKGGDDVVNGHGGADEIRAGGGDDVVRGGRGKDLIYAQAGADLVIGKAHADSLYGGRGRDVLRGNGGRDHLDGGRGKDRLNGGSGKDYCAARWSDRLWRCER